MSYKQISPVPIIEGGTNAQSMATTDGVNYFDGTKIVTTSAGSAGQVLTSNGAGMAPTFQASSGAGATSVFGTSGTLAGSTWNPINSSSVLVLSDTGGIVWSSIYAGSNTSTQAQAQFICPTSGTAMNMYVYITANASSVDVSVTLNVNGANSALVVTVPAGTTGTFSDTTHTVAISAGDQIQWEVSQATTGNITGNITCVFLG